MATIKFELTIEGAVNSELDSLAQSVEVALRRWMKPGLQCEISDEIDRSEDEHEVEE